MSDKITPLHPERERRRRIRKRVFLLIGSTAVVLLVLVLILFWQELNLDKVRRYITYLTVRDSNT